MKAIILAAGSGSRLHPISDNIPKCLVPLGGITLLDFQFQALRSAGIEDMVLVTGCHAEKLKNYARTVHNPNYKTTNMVHSLFCAREEFRGDLLVLYSDIVYAPDIIQKMSHAQSSVSVAIDTDWLRLWKMRMTDPLSDAESLRLNARQEIVDIGRKPKSLSDIEGQYMGIIRIAQKAIPNLIHFYDSLDKTAKYDGRSFDQMYMTTFLRLYGEQVSPLKAVEVSGGWLEIDTLDDLNAYKSLNLQSYLRFNSFRKAA